MVVEAFQPATSIKECGSTIYPILAGKVMA